MKQAASQPKKVLGVSRNVFFLGWVSFLTDVSSDMIFNVLPLFLSNVLGVGTAFIGLIEGLGDSAATILKVASGWFSDKIGRRKGPTTAGYVLSTMAKPFLYIASAGWAVLVIRVAERSGKGIRTSPRDALVADSTSPEEMGRSFGFHRALDTLGAVVGIASAVAIVLFMQRGEALLYSDTFKMLVIIGTIPAVLSVLLLIFFVHERRTPLPKREETVVAAAAGRGLDRRFKLFLGVIVLFTLGNSADAFLVLRAQDIGFSVLYILLLLALFNLVYASISYPSGVLSDRLGRKRLIVAGWSMYALTYLGFALAGAWWHVIFLFALYGVYFGLAEGATRAFVADIVPVERRGTAYGLYHGAVGFALLPASVIAGVLWQVIGPAATFYFGAAMSGAALVGFLFLIRE
jgi:MFS family permease